MAGLSDAELGELSRLSEILQNQTFYDLFDLPQEHDRSTLREKYYELSRRFHPDRFYRLDLAGLEELVEEVFSGINLAYKTLEDPGERTRYDRELVLRGRTPKNKSKAPSAVEKPVEPAKEADDEDSLHVTTLPPQEKPRKERTPEEIERRRRRIAARKRREERGQAPPAVLALKQELMKRMRKARSHYELGVAEAGKANWSAASSSFYLAHQFDPRNATYKERYEEALRRARGQQATQYVALARNAEDYGSHREAVAHYQKAVELDPPDGVAYYRLGRLLRRLDAMDRAALDNLRLAVQKESSKLEYHLELAECFEDHGMKRNALREFQKAAAIDSSNDQAKSGIKRTR